MTGTAKPKRLFKVASEFNVSTQSIVDSLNENGFGIDNKPNVKITPEMYATLESVYGEDKAKSRDHIRAREEYEERRSTFRTGRNESVTLDSFLEPLDDLQPIDEKKGKDEELPLQPIEKSGDEDGKAAPDSTVADELQPEETAQEKEAEPAAAEEQEPAAEDAPDDAEAETEESVPDQAESEVPEETSPAQDTVADDSAKEPDPGEVADADEETEEIPDLDADDADDEPEAAPEIIRGRKEKLAGTRVLGKIQIADPSDIGGRKKRKKGKKGKAEDTTDAASPALEDEDKPRKKKVAAKKVKGDKPEIKPETETDKPKKKKKRIKSRKAPKVDESDVESKMKETMAMLSTGGSAGRKRQKRRKQKREEMAAEREMMQSERQEQEMRVLEVTEFITVSDLADLLGVSPNEIIMHCMNLGMVVSINQRLEASTIELLAEEYDREVVFVDAQELDEDIDEDEEDDPADLKARSPVVTVMGHVDHGKTSLLDYIRKAKVTAGEAGGITQHIGAYEVNLPDKRNITFLDTPGHEAFTAMRARGAQVTDMVILVVAADDAVMPQTIEAINHAQAGGVPLVVAINKIDKEGASTDRIKQQLSDHNVLVEEWGGNVQVAEVSAHTGQGIDELLDKVLIEAELMELKANPDRKASGIILEAKIDRGKGVVANILIQRGTLRVGDPFVAGSYSGKVRALENEFGDRLEEVGPAQPAQLTGFDGIPQAGDKIVSVQDDRTAKNIAQQRQQIKREQSLRQVKHVTLDDISRRLALGEVAELNIIIKGDVDGSIEALAGSLQKISNEEVKVNIIHTGVGAITESDVLLASASNAIIIGFQVRPSANARKLAETEEIDIRLFSVIYDAVDAVRDALEGLLSPELSEKTTATLEVKDTFRVPKAGTIAGCKVTDGKINRNSNVRLIRDGIVIYEGELTSLKRFKDDVKEVASGFECGLGIKNYNDIKVGDVIEAYVVTETKRKLKSETSE
ncbi:translation initiation factor IF-2 [Balneolales bacterium ANBcel1]|nr:translation initiation factor IF-2 [Balneolales bacterium ANBcel1]